MPNMLENIRIASPCSADWEQMQGDDRVRHCFACNRNVYNLSSMTAQEIRNLLAQREGRVCGRLYQRRDGTVLTENCPIGLRAVMRRLSRIAGMVLSVMTPSVVFAQAQSWYVSTNLNDASVEVTVKDSQGMAIPNAIVTLENRTGEQIQRKADRHGRLRLGRRLSGRYSLTVSATGFQASSSFVNLRYGQMLSLDVVLSMPFLMGEIVALEPHKPVDNNLTMVPSTAPVARVPMH